MRTIEREQLEEGEEEERRRDCCAKQEERTNERTNKERAIQVEQIYECAREIELHDPRRATRARNNFYAND